VARASAGDFWAAASADVHPPLYFLLLRAGLHLTGSFPLLRLFSVACGLALVAAAMLAMRERPVSAILSGLVFAGLPELVRHSQELRPYALLYLELGLALLLSIRIVAGGGGKGARLWLCLLLLAAAATHVATAFFLLALAPLLAWPARGSGLRRLAGSLAPLVPAALLLVALEVGYLRGPEQLPEGWWMPPASVGQVAASLADASGWAEVGRFADAVSRHLPAGGALVRGAAIAAMAFGAWVAWGRREGDVLARVLFASGLVYAAALVAFSRMFEPIVIARTLLPGLFPVAVGLAWGVGADPSRVRRAAVVAAVALLVLMACEPGARSATVPRERLRGLAGAARARFRSGDLLVLFRSMDYGLRPYWPDLANAHPLLVDQTAPIGPRLGEMRQRLGGLAPGGRVLVAWCDNYYLRAHGPEVSACLAEISASGLAPHEAWREGDLLLLETDARRR